VRITLNLASRPFFELRPVLLRLRMLAGALAVLALVLFLLLRQAEVKADRAEAVAHKWTVATDQLQREWQQDQALMKEPDNAATLQRSDFLNQIFFSKSFSWTTAMMDLERVLPLGVQVTSIDPQMTKGRVMMRLRVNGPRDKVVTLVSNLEKSPHFIAPLVAGETADIQGQGQAGFRPTMSETTDVNVDIIAGFNSGDLASTDVNAEEKKSGTHLIMHEDHPRQTGAASTSHLTATHPRPAGNRGVR
jgi:type IV pilus assembly protein PilN